MATSKVQALQSSLHTPPLKLPEGFKSKVVFPRNPKIVLRKDRPRRVTPSVYAQEMLQSTEERLANTNEMYHPRILELLDMSDTTHQKFSLVDVDVALFQPYPSELVFQNFSPLETYELPLLLRNNDKVSRQVKVVPGDSPCFRVVGQVDVYNKVAPGMTSTFSVFFTPQENKDYHHRLECVTERERFEVLIHAIGSRGILDFRDELHLPICPVKACTQRTQLVRNIGHTQAKFQLQTQSPFSVTPAVGTLGVGESMQVIVAFNPRSVGNHCQDMLLHYHTGEEVHISLYGACEELDMCLEPASVLLEDTYISLVSQRSVSLTNNSNIPLHYRWKAWPSQEEEDLHTLRDLQDEEDEERERLLSESASDPAEFHRVALLSRSFRERRRRAAEDRLPLSSHSSITVEPMEGEIWPSTTATFNIIFKPHEARLYQHTFYCDVTGRECCLPLTVMGDGIGPKLQFSYNLMDMQNVFIGAKNCYEVLVSNRGLIDAPFKMSCPNSTFGRCFSFSPEEGIVPPGACQALEVVFSSSTLGTFSEDLLLTVTGQPQPLTLTFRGRVIGPTFNFNVSELNFGDVAFGFPHTLTCTLFNTSLVPMAFVLRVLGDGSGPVSVSSAVQVSELSRNQWHGTTAIDTHARPSEFTLRPASGTVRAMSDITVEVTLCSNTVQRYRLALVVDVEGVGEEVLTLPINARCVVPEVMVETPVLVFHRCFLGHPYQQLVRLTNTSSLPACYGLLDQEYEERPAVLYGSAHPRGVIPPSSSVEVPIFLLAKALGRLQHTAPIAVFGRAQTTLEVTLSCIGQGPAVHVHTPELDYGRIPVLTDITRTLLLSNQSPIPARFTAHMVRTKSVWHVEPSEGEVPPEGQLKLRLVAHLKDTLPFQDRLQLAIHDGQTHTIPLSATGTGTTIVSDRPLGPSLDLGTHFSHGPCQYHFRLTNHGQRLHRLYWATDNSPLFPGRASLSLKTSREENISLPSITPPRRGKAPGRGALAQSTRDKAVFSLSPSRVELFPGCSVDMVLTGSSDSPNVVRERLVCHAVLGHQGRYEHIMTVDIACCFVTPVLSFSSRQLSFYIEKVPGTSLVPLYEKLVLKNVSSLALTMDLTLDEPFSLCDTLEDPSPVTTKAMVLQAGMQAEVWARFNPAYRQDLESRVADELLRVCYREHPQQDMVGLHGEVHFPNLHFSSTSLDFGCVLNCTEIQRELTVTNCSPLPVSYHWTFLVDQKQYIIRFAEEQEVVDGKPIAQEDNRELGWLPKMNTNSKLDSNREAEGPRFSLLATQDEEEEEEEEEGREKRDPENLTKEGRGSPKEPPLSAPLSPSLLLEAQTAACSPVGVEEVFDILPIYGQLQPGASQLVTFTFYGHAHISGQVLAQCHVDEGPVYDITLRGEASEVTYSLNSTHIDLGLQLFNRVAEAEVILLNQGKVGFNFSTLLPHQQTEGGQESREKQRTPEGPEDEEDEFEGRREGLDVFPAELRPGQPVVLPNTGYVEAGAVQYLRVFYLPGVPEVFHKSFHLQVAFLLPQDITLTGEGVFPRMCLDLPRPLQDKRYNAVVQQARAAVEADREREEAVSRHFTAGGKDEGYVPTYEELLHHEIDRLLVKENAATITSSLLELGNMPSSNSRWRKLSRFLLPEYVLDFGYVIHCEVLTHTVKIINTGPVAVSFCANSKPLAGTGFSSDFERVRNLPHCETQTFTVKFDPRGANLEMGGISVIMPIQVTGGPTVQVRLCAVVTMPGLTVSTDQLLFDRVQCGMCQVITIQLFNHEAVPCHWSIAEEKKPRKKPDKFLPLHLRKKALLEQCPPPVVFEMIPSSGLLYPRDRVNVQVKFSPAEGRAYSKQLVVCVAQSSQRVVIMAQGHGEEPRLEWCPDVLELGPCLPLSAGDRAEVTVRNPCAFPIDFYSLEFDTQYLEEEKILRVMKGYDEKNLLLLPPRSPGEGLPPEMLEHYKEHYSKPAHHELVTSDLCNEEVCAEKRDGQEEKEGPEQIPNQSQGKEKVSLDSKEGAPYEMTREESGHGLGQLETTPVSRAIARHMGLDMSPEGLAARNRRGVALIVHGAPLTGKSSTAAALAHHYGGVCLSVDAVVTEALTSGTSSASLNARQLYECAATEHAQKKAEEAAQVSQDTMAAVPVPAAALITAPAPDGSPVVGTLSIEALAKHTEDGRHSTDSRAPKKTGGSVTTVSQGGQTQSVILNQVGINLSHLLPEQLLVEILAERLQLSDCHRATVIDGLECTYTRSVASSLQVVLKAFNNRKHIYLVNLSDSFTALKTRQRAQQEAKEALEREVAEREKRRLQEMDEEEYDALPEEEKELLAKRHLDQLRQRRDREMERAMREQEEKKQQEELERLREEDEMKRKNKKGGKKDNKEDLSGKKSQLALKQSTVAPEGRKMSSCNTTKESPIEASRDMHGREPVPQDRETEDPLKKKKKDIRDPQEESPRQPDESLKDVQFSDENRRLLSRFRAYEQSQPHVAHILQHWDRTQGLLLVPLLVDEPPQEAEEVPQEKQPPAGKKTRKEREKEKERQKVETSDAKVASPAPGQPQPPGEGGGATGEEESSSSPDVIPCILLAARGKGQPSTAELLEGSCLPSLEEVLDALGLGPSGPPIPPPTTFTIVPFPEERAAPRGQLTCDRLTFLVPSGSDEAADDKTRAEANADTLAPATKEEVRVTPSKGRGKKTAAVTKDKDDKDKKDRDSQRDKRRMSAKRGGRSSDPSPTLSSVSALSDHTDQARHPGDSQETRQRLTMFRWTVPANGEVTLKLWFHSDIPGKFEESLNFELVGTRRHYQLFCRALCHFPSISKDYKTLFALNKRVSHADEGLQKAYVINTGVFEFGPLLCGKTRDRYKEKKYPENIARLVIHNDSALEAEVHFCFQHDTKAATYLLDPPTMTLQPDDKQELTVWAYPTSVGQIEDTLVCCIKDNPEPVTIHLSCWGVRPELELDRKQLHFDRILLHRDDSRSVTLRNKTSLPAAWRLSGLEELGGEFSVSQERGAIAPNSSFCLTFYLRAVKPINIKRTIRLEVSDMENILGIVHTENMHIIAEAYDVALDIAFPKGANGGLDFGTIKVSEEVKRFVNLKNKGKYEIAYKFILERTDLSQQHLASIFTISPHHGTLQPTERSTAVQVLFKHNKEVSLKDQPVLRCQVIEPSIGDKGETIAIIPVKVSVQSVFSRYKITPTSGISFGPLVYGCRRTQTFTIENTGEFETRFSIYRLIKHMPGPPGRPGGLGPVKRVPRESHSAKLPAASRRMESTQKDTGVTQVRLTVGVFTVSPCAGTLLPGAHQVVTVDCGAEQVGNWSECLSVDISDRDPSEQPGGIPYRLVAEVCVPEIGGDFSSIFEEHRLCRSSSLLSSEEFRDAESIYVLDGNKFIFNNVLVGRSAQARFKLTNNGKVSCLLSLAIKPVSTKLSRSLEVFDMSPAKLCIPSQSHAFAVVTFTPQTMQLYHTVFEATLEGATSTLPMVKNRTLAFDLIGEGNLPSVCVVRPALRNSQGHHILQFGRTLVGSRHAAPLVLRNDSNVSAQVQMDMLDKQGVFTLKAALGNSCSSIHTTQLKDTTDSERQLVHGASFRLSAGQRLGFEVVFCSERPLRATVKMTVQVKDNQYNSTVILASAEAYQDIISLHSISGASEEEEVEQDEEGANAVLNFADCQVGRRHQESFTMTNHSSSQVLRFEWPAAGPHISFSPQVGHLHAGCSKEVNVTFSSNQPVTLSSEPMRCKLCQVEFEQPMEHVADWDDRQRTVRWVPASKKAVGPSPQQQQPQPTKNKLIKTEPEPSCSVVEGSHRELELSVSAECHHAKFSCEAESITFKDTMLYQTRLHQLQMVNQGSVKLDYSWQVLMDPNGNISYDQGDVTPGSRPGSRSAAVMTCMRPSSALASVTSLMMGDPELPPFTVEPNVGTVGPGAVQTFNIRFSPLDVAMFRGRLACSISNLQDGVQAPCMSVCGRSLLPYCHFHLEDSDYISGKRRSSEFRGPLDPNTRVIEFNSVGLSVPMIRCFSVVNPTNKPYSFQWRSEGSGACPFRCLTPHGSIMPGKKVEVCLEYMSEQLGVVESSWSFLIEKLSLSVPFLLVGNCREPLVYLDRAHLDLGNLLVGCSAEQTVYIVNGEQQPFHFSVLESSLHSEAQLHSLLLAPMSGTVAARGRLPLSVSLTPSQEGSVSFRLLVKVKGRAELLALSVKADGYTMNACVQVENIDQGLREISPDCTHTHDFGKVELSDHSILTLLLSNLGRFHLDVNFDLTGPRNLLHHLEAKPHTATVEVGKQLRWCLRFCPQAACDLQDVRLLVKVMHGPVFPLAIEGRAVAPGLGFSFTKHHFGACFLHCAGMVPVTKTLVVSNKGEKGTSIRCQIQNISHLEVCLQTDIVPPGGTVEVPIIFYPRRACRYHDKLTFIINNCAKQVVDIEGQGIEMRLDVEDPSQRKVNLGALLPGHKVKKQVTLVNRSSADLSFSLLLNMPTLLEPRVLSFSPTGELILKAYSGRCVVEILYSPHQRMSPFTADLQAECLGMLRPLLTIHGCCQGVEVQLDQDYLAFGAVAQRCKASKRTVMMNTGDIGASFRWDVESFPPEFSIVPSKGYICPGMDVPFDVTFAPVELSNDTRYENLPCFVEGSPAPITLTLTGSCITTLVTKEVLSFTCVVRGSHSQTLTLSNPTSQRWSLKPALEGEHWSAAPSFVLEPYQNKAYEITYRPLTMVTEGKKHQGSVFFSFPDGTGVLYALQGTADPPRPEAIISHELPAKTQHTELLAVCNWLTKPQRFHVLIELLKPERPDATVALKGLDYIDVPPLAKRDYRLNFSTYKEGMFNAKVTFRNEVSAEFLFYNVGFKATSPGVLSTLELVTPVRQTVSSSIEVENPLSTAICLSAECKCLDISVPPQRTVPGQSKGTLSFEYQPLRAGESTARLSLHSSELGYFHYELQLRAPPPPPEKDVYFSCPLGSSHSTSIKFINYSRIRAEYSCKTDCSNFIVDKNISASSGFQVGSEVSVEVCFEPHQLGEVRGQLTLSSGAGGDYFFPLHGTCVPPKAQGPFNIRAGSNVSMPFKNVFLQTTVFSFQVDNPCFTVKGVDSMRSKKTHNILVSFEPPPGSSRGPCFGKLTITSPRSEGHGQPCSWVYYLKGYSPDSGQRDRDSNA